MFLKRPHTDSKSKWLGALIVIITGMAFTLGPEASAAIERGKGMIAYPGENLYHDLHEFHGRKEFEHASESRHGQAHEVELIDPRPED